MWQCGHKLMWRNTSPVSLWMLTLNKTAVLSLLMLCGGGSAYLSVPFKHSSCTVKWQALPSRTAKEFKFRCWEEFYILVLPEHLGSHHYATHAGLTALLNEFICTYCLFGVAGFMLFLLSWARSIIMLLTLKTLDSFYRFFPLMTLYLRGLLIVITCRTGMIF